MVVGLLFLCRGLSSLLGVLGGSRGTGQSVPVGQWPGWWAALIQAVCGALVLVGLFTRPAALIASGSMAYACFTVHQPDGLLPIRNGGELAAGAAPHGPGGAAGRVAHSVGTGLGIRGATS
ncbi:DoxX family protein [Micromonospora sp. NPDC047548]|uniref:DoxX family protein n=1 Tax=Micromonospora sp. NPDC047548 TaxID=3155624 RepID=UPI0033FAFEA6